jgi:hypothetical protein
MPAHPKPSQRKALKLTPTVEPVPANQAEADAQAHAADTAKPPPVHKPKKPRAPSAMPAERAQTKGEKIIGMLKTAGGATSKEIEEAVGWQAHSVRGFLGTLRKQGVAVTSTKPSKGEPTVYRIAKAAPRAEAPAEAAEVL